MKILAIETSCDETSAAVVENGTKILSNVVATSSQMHQKYGGIVPEIAARKQLEFMIPVLNEAIKTSSPATNSFDAIAVTVGPGLIGSLLVGVETAKTLAFARNKPIIPVNHVIAHMYANFISYQPSDISNQTNTKHVSNSIVIPDLIGNLKTDKKDPRFRGDDIKNIQFPAISLVVSGGHTELYLMTAPNKLKWLGGTIDDAAGECFDKAARILGFGSGGGLTIQKSASCFELRTSNFELKLPRPMLYDKTLNFSFSGLKTALFRELKKYQTNSQPITHNPQLISQFAYELQEAITDVLVKKTLSAAEIYHAKSILISGGVASNLRLREKLSSKGRSAFGRNNVSTRLFAPQINLCTDNAAFIASYAYFHQKPVDWRKITAVPDLSVEI